MLADATSSVFYPGKLLFMLPLDFALRYKLYIVSHVVLAAINSYVLARAWRASHFASALVMGTEPSRSGVRLGPNVAASTVSDCHLIPVICRLE